LLFKRIEYRLPSVPDLFGPFQFILYIANLYLVQRAGLLLPVAGYEGNGVVVLEQRFDGTNLVFFYIKFFRDVFSCCSQCDLSVFLV